MIQVSFLHISIYFHILVVELGLSPPELFLALFSKQLTEYTFLEDLTLTEMWEDGTYAREHCTFDPV